MRELIFVNQLNNDQLDSLIRRTIRTVDSNLVIHGGSETIGIDGEKCISLCTGRGRQSLFTYEITDTTMTSYIFGSDQQFGSYDDELKNYLTAYFGSEYTEFLSQIPLQRVQKEDKVKVI
jgi:hypothetical protein